MPSLGHWWWRVRRDLRRGPRATWGDYVLRPRIWQWRNPHAAGPTMPVHVHVLAGAEHVDLAAWMMASWLTHTAANWQFVVHDDGTLTAAHGARLTELGIAARLIPAAEADARLAPLLESRPLCARYRRQHPLGRKIFDAPVFAGDRRFILLDTDVLFFAPPRQMIAWAADARADSCWFNADCAEASNVSAAEASTRLGVALWPKVNSGICLLTPAAFDPDFCERVLRDTTALAGHVWRVEQTLFALCASRQGRGGLLPADYEVSLAWHGRPGSVARHYVGAVRDRFFGEGIPRFQRTLLAHARTSARASSE